MSENHSNLNIKPLVGNTTPTIVEVNATEETPSNVNRLLPQGSEATDVNLNLNRTQTWATAGPTSQRSVRVQAPTLASTAATTITTAATVEIDKAPVAGTNVTITTPLALHIAAGKTEFAPSTTSNASVNIPVGSTPSSPVDGDIWQTTLGFYFKSGGNVIGPLSGTVGDYAVITSQTDQTLAKDTENLIEFDTNDAGNHIGIDTPPSNKIYFDNAGTYKVHVLANLKHTAGGTETTDIWLKKNGSNIANTARNVQVDGNNNYHLLDHAWIITTTSNNEYIQIAMSATDTDIVLEHNNAITTPYVRPAYPSIAVIITQVVDSSILISGAINLDGGHPDSNYGGISAINCGGV